jgi:hypothetical protein
MGLGPIPLFGEEGRTFLGIAFPICRLCVEHTWREFAGMLLGAIMELNRREKPEQR